ncbi:MAG: 2-hydroxyacid dehydrogenase [Lautropia sp.]
MKVTILGQHYPYAPLLQKHLGSADFDVAGMPSLKGPLETDVLVTSRLTPDEASSIRARLLHVPGIGLDAIPFSALPPGCVVCNVGMHEIPIAEYVAHAVLDYCIFPAGAKFSFEQADWLATYVGRPLHGEARGQNALIVGLGKIGQEVASRLKAFGMRIVAIDPHAEAGRFADEVHRVDSLDVALRSADVVVLSLPLKESTRGLIGRRQLALMKGSALFINVSRAQLVDEDALYEALTSRRIGRAVLDVWYAYPSSSDPHAGPSTRRFWDLDNVRATPHISGWSTGLIHRRYEFIAENIRRLMRGEVLMNIVDRPQGP